MSNKKTPGHLTFGQYRLADIMMFLLIMGVCEAVNVLAIRKWFPGMMFTVSVMLPVSLIVLVRWNWFAAFFPLFDGVLYCWMNGAGAATYLIYGVGNSFILLSWFLFKLYSKEKWISRWLTTLALTLISFVLLLAGRTVLGLCVSIPFTDIFMQTLISESVNLLFAVVVLLIARKADGLLEDQKKYLLRVAKDNEVKSADEEQWDGYTELDEDELKKLGGLHRDCLGIMPQDEYPPDSR